MTIGAHPGNAMLSADRTERHDMRPSTLSALEHIENIRVRNNKVWMQLVHLAIEYAPPEKLEGLFHDIEINDSKINEWWKCLRETLHD